MLVEVAASGRQAGLGEARSRACWPIGLADRSRGGSPGSVSGSLSSQEWRAALPTTS